MLGVGVSGPESAEEKEGSGSENGKRKVGADGGEGDGGGACKDTEMKAKRGCEVIVNPGKGKVHTNNVKKEEGGETTSQLHQMLQDIQQV